jgi:hypothetical protein
MASQEDNSYLVISDATNQDSGVYTASATNTNGEAKSYGRLTVSEQTITSDGHNVTSSSSSTTTTTAASNKIGGQPPEFKKLFLDRHVTPGEDVRLDAVITGSPKPKVNILALKIRTNVVVDSYFYLCFNLFSDQVAFTTR